MKTLLNVTLLLAWLAVYLGVVYLAGRYRRARVRAHGIAGPNEFRADKDVGLWCVSLVTGVVLCAAVFLAAKMFGGLP